MANFDIPQSFVLQDTKTGVIETALDGFFDCRDFSIFDPAGCKTPYDPSFCFPFLPDDVIYIQTNETPTTIEFFEFDGTPQTIPYTLTNKTIIINAADIASFISCFYLQIDGNCTYGYQRLFCDAGTVVLSSEYTAKDYLGFDYADGYKNTLRLFGGFEFIGIRHEDKSNGRGQIVTRAQYDRYRLVVPNLPEAIAKLVLNICSGKNVQINKDLYYNKVSLTDKTLDTVLWSIESELERYNNDFTFC